MIMANATAGKAYPALSAQPEKRMFRRLHLDSISSTGYDVYVTSLRPNLVNPTSPTGCDFHDFRGV
jgi:hypothetical protein